MKPETWRMKSVRLPDFTSRFITNARTKEKCIDDWLVIKFRPTRRSRFSNLKWSITLTIGSHPRPYLCFATPLNLPAWRGCWYVVYIRRFIYKFLNVCPFDYTAVVGSWKVNHTSWVVNVTPTDRPKSVRNRSVIELFCDAVCVVILPLWHFCWCRGFCHRTESDLSLFL